MKWFGCLTEVPQAIDARTESRHNKIASIELGPDFSTAPSTLHRRLAFNQQLPSSLGFLQASFCTRHIVFIRHRRVYFHFTPHMKKRCPSHSRPCPLAPLWLSAQLAHNGTIYGICSCSSCQGLTIACRCAIRSTIPLLEQFLPWTHASS